MPPVNNVRIIRKLEEIIDFRVGDEASKKHPIIFGEGKICPATDGTQIFLPRKSEMFKSEEDNEMCAGNSTAHEADHIREIEGYFGSELDELRGKKVNLVQEYCQRNYSELEENPALAGWIDNVVKDRRIDAQRIEQLPGIKKHYAKVLGPAAEYFRPSVNGMSELDRFREQYLQKALIGRVVEPVLEKHAKLLEEIVSITESADSIYKDKEVVTRVYQIFKENFDIRQDISKLPSMEGTGDSSQPTSGYPQKGYGKEVKPREGRNSKERKPDNMKGDEKEEYVPNKGKKDKEQEKDKEGEEEDQREDENKNEEKPINSKDSKEFYDKEARDNEMHIDSTRNQTYAIKPSDQKIPMEEKEIRNRFAGEIESMKQMFRRLQLRHYGEKRDFEGHDLDYEEYLRADLEQKVTGIIGNGKYFREEYPNEQRPCFGIHADVSGSTAGIIENIKAAFYVVGNALSASNWNYGLYASAERLCVIKDPTKKWEESINRKIMGLIGNGSGIYLARTSNIISKDLMRAGGNPKCLVVISDFEVCEEATDVKVAADLMKSGIYPMYIAIGNEHEGNVKNVTRGLGEEHYSVIPLDKLNELPNEMFRLFKTFGIAR